MEAGIESIAKHSHDEVRKGRLAGRKTNTGDACNLAWVQESVLCFLSSLENCLHCPKGCTVPASTQLCARPRKSTILADVTGKGLHFFMGTFQG